MKKIVASIKNQIQLRNKITKVFKNFQKALHTPAKREEATM